MASHRSTGNDLPQDGPSSLYLPARKESVLAPIAGLGLPSAVGCERAEQSSSIDNPDGLDYMLARYYSSGLGRFLSPVPSDNEIDPENPQSWNRYTYVLNNPLRYTDPDGLETYLSIDEEPADYIEGKRGEVPGRTDFTGASAVFNKDTKQYDVTFKVTTLITTKPVQDKSVVLQEERDHQEQVRESIKETGNANLDQKINNKGYELEKKAEKKGWSKEKLDNKKEKMIKKTLKKANKKIKKLYNKKQKAYHKANR